MKGIRVVLPERAKRPFQRKKQVGALESGIFETKCQNDFDTVLMSLEIQNDPLHHSNTRHDSGGTGNGAFLQVKSKHHHSLSHHSKHSSYMMQRVLLSESRGVAIRRSFTRFYHELSYASHGEPSSVLQYVHLPDISDEEPPSYLEDAVRIEMWHAPLNPADINTIQGKYPSPFSDENKMDHARIRSSRFEPGMTVAGSEGWGHVTNIVGDSNGIKVGDAVVVGQPGLGTFRSSFWADATSLLPLTQGHELMELFGSQAAAVPQLGGTALRMLRDFVSLQPGDVVLQNAGNSGVAFMASQLGKALLDVSVVSIARRTHRSAEQWDELVEHLMTDGKCAKVVAEEELAGRDAIKDFQQELRKLSRNGQLPSLALNAVGGESASILCKCLEVGGTMVTYGGMSMKAGHNGDAAVYLSRLAGLRILAFSMDGPKLTSSKTAAAR